MLRAVGLGLGLHEIIASYKKGPRPLPIKYRPKPWAYLEGAAVPRLTLPNIEENFALFKYSLSSFCQTTCTICAE